MGQAHDPTKMNLRIQLLDRVDSFTHAHRATRGLRFVERKVIASALRDHRAYERRQKLMLKSLPRSRRVVDMTAQRPHAVYIGTPNRVDRLRFGAGSTGGNPLLNNNIQRNMQPHSASQLPARHSRHNQEGPPALLGASGRGVASTPSPPMT